MVRIRLTKKLAVRMNGVDVSRSKVGDVLEIEDDRAELLLAAEWAEPVGRAQKSNFQYSQFKKRLR
jgi:hypothetical protein